jgi:hypothetical protein
VSAWTCWLSRLGLEPVTCPYGKARRRVGGSRLPGSPGPSRR